MSYTPGLNGGRINATISGNTAGAGALVSTGTMTLAGGNNITLSQAGNAITISGGAGGAGATFGVSTQGNTVGDTGTTTGQLILSGGNNITLSQSTNGAGAVVGISGESQTNQTVGLYALGNTTQNSSTTRDARSMSFNGLGLATMGYSNGSIQVSVTQTVQTQNRFNMTLTGNTAGAMAQVSSGTLTLAGGNNITLSQAGNAITISGGAGGGGFTAGMSTGGNTSGTTGTVTNQMIFAGGNNITLSQSTGAGGNTITVIAPNIATASAPFAQQLAGNSTSAGAGYSTITSGTMQWAGGNNITLSQDGQSVTISAGNGGGGADSMDYYQNMDRGTTAVLGTAHRTLMLQCLNQENNPFAHNITANTMLLNMTGSFTATSLSSSHSYSISVGIYLDQTTRLSLVNSASTSWGFTAHTSISANYHGPRWISFVSSQWSSAPNFVAGSDYVFGVLVNSSNYAVPLSYIGQNFMISGQRSGSIGTTLATNTSMAHGNYWNAMHSVTQSSLPSTIASNAVNRNNATAMFMPHVVLNNRYSGTM